MSNDQEIPTHLNVRIDPKVRFLTDLAARARKVRLTDYVEEALNESFRRVFVIEQEEEEPLELTLSERQKLLAPPEGSLAHYADALWSENPGVRLALRVNKLKLLLSDDETTIFNYILSQKDLAPNGRLDVKAISSRWTEIKVAALGLRSLFKSELLEENDRGTKGPNKAAKPKASK